MLRHNKKKNTYILFEQLTNVLTRLAAAKQHNEANVVLEVLKKYFKTGTLLNQEKKLFESILKWRELQADKAQKILEEVLIESSVIKNETIEKEKNNLINEINAKITKELYKIPVKNYKKLASIQILFNDSRKSTKTTTPEERIDIKNSLLESMQQKREEQLKVDNLTFKVLVSNFNKKYKSLLNENQKELVLKLLTENSDENLVKFLENRKEYISITLEKFLGQNKEHENKKELKEALIKIKGSKVEKNNIREESNLYLLMKYFDLLETLRGE